MPGTQVRMGPRARDSKSDLLALPLAPSGSNSFPPWDLGQEREDKWGQMMGEWGRGKRDDSLVPLPRERPLHPSQLGSLSPKLVGRGHQKL